MLVLILKVMQIFSYQHHLSVLTQRAKPKFIHKTLLLTLGVTLLCAGFISSLIYYQFKKDEPLRAENHYLQSTIGAFSTAKQSVDETLRNFQVAGAKIKIIDNLKESTPQAAGYYALLDDIDRTTAKVEALEKNIRYQNSQTKRQKIPGKFDQITRDLTSFYETSLKTLEGTIKEQQFAKDILIASGTSFYLPVLSDEAMWAAQGSKQIKAYYETRNIEANTALASLAKLTVPDSFRSYYDNQIAYLTLFVETGSKIIDTLEKQDDQNTENATQIEKAYQILNAAKAKNQQISQNLLTQRLKVYDPKRNLETFAQMNLMAGSINDQLVRLAANQPQPKTDQLLGRLKDFYYGFQSKILNPLQNRPVI